MSHPRKTIEISRIVEMTNNMLSSRSIPEKSKKDMCILLEYILQETSNYKGFKYYDWVNGGQEAWINAGRPDTQSKFLGREYSRIYY